MNTQTQHLASHRVPSFLRNLVGITLFGSLLSVLHASEDPFISVDFSGDNRFGQSGWTNWLSTSGFSKEFPISDPFVTENGKVTVSLTSDSGTIVVRDRNTTGFSSDFHYINLYRDVFIASKAAGASSSTLTITFSGLNANTAYEVFFYALDTAKTSSVEITTVTGTVSTSWSTIDYTVGSAAAYTENTGLGVAGTSNIVKTNPDGIFSFEITNSAGDKEGFLNGFQIATAVVPEPSITAFLVGIGSLLIIPVVRRFR